MANNKKPRKKMRQSRIIINPLQVASSRARKLDQHEIKLLIDPVWECFNKLKFGGMLAEDYKHLADAMNVAQALTMPGLNLLPDHADKFDAAHYALKAIAERYNAGHNWIGRAEELQAIQTGIEFHEIQLEFCSAGEITKATQIVDRALKGARSGSAGKEHFHTELRAA